MVVEEIYRKKYLTMQPETGKSNNVLTNYFMSVQSEWLIKLIQSGGTLCVVRNPFIMVSDSKERISWNIKRSFLRTDYVSNRLLLQFH